MAAIDFVQQTKFALDEEMDERDLAVIEVREIDAGIEDAAVFVLRMVDSAAAQNAHFDRVVKQYKVDGSLQRRGRPVVLRIEEFGVDQGDVADVAPALDLGLAEIDGAIDGAEPGNEEDWERILAAFEGLDALGVPDNLPESAVSELVHVELLVQASGSVEEFTSAVQDSPPPSDTMDGYIDDNC